MASLGFRYSVLQSMPRMFNQLLLLLLKMSADSAASLESHTLLGDDGLRAILSRTSPTVLHVTFAQPDDKSGGSEDRPQHNIHLVA